MTQILAFLIFFFSFSFPVFAQELSPTTLPNPNPDYYPAYCHITLDVLSPNSDIYTCKYNFTFVSNATFNTQAAKDLFFYSNCWNNTMNNYNLNDSNIILSKKIVSNYIPPESFAQPCQLKSAAPDAPSCSPIDASSLVNGAFSNKFPLDLFTGFVPLTGELACPVMTVMNQSFPLCYLNKLVASLKYVLLVVFIISSVIAL
ncbi:MAG TPA: hypothetical protein VEY70_24925 [Metabacillus sp.]|nr:hypothetical protein [Metabacillus sp.]